MTQAIIIALFGIATYVGLGQYFSGTIRPHEQLGGAMLVMFLLPVF